MKKRLDNKLVLFATFVAVLILVCPTHAAFTQRILDHFTDTDFTNLSSHTSCSGCVGVSWTAGTGTIITFSNGADATVPTAVYINNTTLDTSKIQYAAAKIPDRSGRLGPAICLSYSGGNAQGIFLESFNTFYLGLHKFTGSGTAYNDIDITIPAISNNDVTRLEFDGTNKIHTYVNGFETSASPYTDTSCSTAVVGLVGISTAVNSLDDFDAGDDTGGGGATQYLFPPTLTGVGGPGLFLAPWIH